MKIFISWSGDISGEIAKILRGLIKTVLPYTKPFISSEDIKKGDPWLASISQELDETECGILCVTPDNCESPWLNFEAGALSKSRNAPLVAPLLIGVERSKIPETIRQFNDVSYSKEELFKLLQSLNSSAGDRALPDNDLRRNFQFCWPHLQEQLEPLVSQTLLSALPRAPNPPRTEFHAGTKPSPAASTSLPTGSGKQTESPTEPSMGFGLRTISTLIFDFASSDVDTRGWSIGSKGEKPSIETSIDDTVGRVVEIVPADNYHMDYKVSAAEKTAKRVEFVFKPGNSWVLYSKVKVVSSKEARYVWLAIRAGVDQPSPLGKGSVEWSVFIQPKVIDKGWVSIEADLRPLVAQTFGKNGYQYDGLVGFRIRGHVTMSRILIYGN